MGGAAKSSTRLEPGTYNSPEDIVGLLEKELEFLKTSHDATAWMDLCRTARQSYILWHIDYIEPRDSIVQTNNLIKQSEELLYEDKTNIQLKNGYSADLQQQAAFNTIRAHLRAEEKDFQSALTIFQSLLDEHYDNLSTIRQSNLLMHCCLAFLCCNKWQKSYEYFTKHWILTKSLPEEERISLGIWDNQVIMQMIYWFLCFHLNDFREFYNVQSGSETNVWAHKKIPLMNFLRYDDTWAVNFMGLAFYEHLCDQHPSLSRWEKKATTAQNYFMLWEKNEGEALQKEKSNISPIEKTYFERYNKQFTQNVTPDMDEAMNCLQSYYYFQTDFAHEEEMGDLLFMFIMKHLGFHDYKTVLYVGAGKAWYPEVHDRRVTVVDVSEYACKSMKQANLPVSSIINQCMSKFITTTDQQFDLCVARDVLQDLPRTRLDIFLHHLPIKCKYIAAVIDLRPNVRTDILSKSNITKEINLHQSMLLEEEWLCLLSKGFDLQHEKNGEYLYVFGERIS